MAPTDNHTPEGEPRDFAHGEATLPSEPRWIRAIGPTFGGLVLAAILAVAGNYLDDVRRDEILGTTVRRLDQIAAQVQGIREYQLTDRYSGAQAREDWQIENARHRELESRFDQLERDLRAVQIELARRHGSSP